MGNPTCYSFYATKNMTTGEGGAVVTEDYQLAARLRTLRLHGISKDAWQRYSAKGSWYYEIEEAGWKYNMTDLQAAIGIHQISKLDGLILRRRQIAEHYDKAFESSEQLRIPTERKGLFHAYHLYALLVPSDSRSRFLDNMKQRNIGTSVHFIPLHLHPFYAQKYGFKRGDYPVAEHLYDCEVSLPLYPGMTDQDVDDVVEAVNFSLNH
jgi:dTDP-4-amino-4,6-dideoxygalactose transaminase